MTTSAVGWGHRWDGGAGPGGCTPPVSERSRSVPLPRLTGCTSWWSEGASPGCPPPRRPAVAARGSPCWRAPRGSAARSPSARWAGSPVDEGADSMLTRVPDGLALAREAGLEPELVSPATGQAFVWSRGALRPLPTGTLLGLPTDLAALARSGLLSGARAQPGAAGPAAAGAARHRRRQRRGARRAPVRPRGGGPARRAAARGRLRRAPGPAVAARHAAAARRGGVPAPQPPAGRTRGERGDAADRRAAVRLPARWSRAPAGRDRPYVRCRGAAVHDRPGAAPDGHRLAAGHRLRRRPAGAGGRRGRARRPCRTCRAAAGRAHTHRRGGAGRPRVRLRRDHHARARRSGRVAAAATSCLPWRAARPRR